MMVNGNLPDGWEWMTIGDVTLPIEKVDPKQKPDKEFTYLDIASIDNSVHRITEPKSYYGSDAPSRARQLVQANDVLFSTVRTYLENIAQVPEIHDGQIASTGFSVLRANELVLSKYLFYYSLTQNFLEPLNELQRGTSYPAVRDGDVRVQMIPVAPLPEQERIVSRIEELFSDLEAGVAALERVRAGLRRYKASVLKSAFEGKLQKQDDEDAHDLINRILHERHVQWKSNIRARGKNPKKLAYEELQFPSTDDLTELPNNWQWVTWEMILAHEDGAFRRSPFGSTLKKSIFVQSGFKVYEQYCAINDDCSFGRYYITPELFEELRSFEVKPGDYLISCSGVTLGRITRVPESSERGVINQALLRVRINDQIIDHKYFVHYFRSPYFQERLFDSSTGTAIPNVKGVKELKALPIPLPPLDEQRRIVAEVERRLSVVGEVESAVDVGLARSARLRQSVLRSAFEGRL